MYKVYFRQAVQMLKQNKFFSIIYIAGTGLAIAMVMILAILYYFHTANIEPESYRDRMMIIQSGKVAKKEGKGYGSSQLSYPTIKECFYPMQIPEAVTAVIPLGEQSEFIQLQGNKNIYNGLVMGTDAAFWKVFNFTFLYGTPYTEEEFTSGIRKAVLCESLARKLFNTTDAAGKTFLLNFEEYTVAGVVKDVPSITSYCYAELWLPFTNRPSVIKGGSWCDYVLGRMRVYILAKSWLLGRYNWDGSSLTASIDLSPGMFLNPAIFGYAFAFCLILNLLSALVPAWRALRKPVVDALNDK